MAPLSRARMDVLGLHRLLSNSVEKEPGIALAIELLDQLLPFLQEPEEVDTSAVNDIWARVEQVLSTPSALPPINIFKGESP